MNVRACGVACIARKCDFIALFYCVADRNKVFAVVGVKGCYAAAVGITTK